MSLSAQSNVENGTHDAHSSVAMFEEKIRIEEMVLKDLLERRTELSDQLESVRLRRKQLLERRKLLKERKLHLQKARIKHLTLQKDLYESLTKSRERLARLTTLEKLQRESQDDTASCEVSAFSEEPANLESSVEIENSGDSFDFDMDSDAGSVDVNSGDRTEEMIDSGEQADELKGVSSRSHISFEDLHAFNEKHAHVRSLMNFLPAVDHHTMRAIVRLGMREAMALDLAGDNAVRRCLLWHTCVDFALLNQHSTDTAANSSLRDSSEVSPAQLDPNVTLCPYELSGVCADEFCPYQHTTKATLPREEIPLPSLSLDRGAEDAKKTPESEISAASDDKKTPTIEADIVGNENGGHEVTEDGDFIALPVVKSDQEMEETSSNADDERDGEVELLTTENVTEERQGSSPSHFGFWWGGRIEADGGSLDQVLDHLRGKNDQSVASSSASVETDQHGIASSLAVTVEAVRIALHAGRFDLADSFITHADGILPEMYRSMVERLRYITKHSFFYQSIEYSFVRTSFEGQVALGILSTYLEKTKNSSNTRLLLLDRLSNSCTSMWSFGGIWSSEEEFTITDFRNILMGSREDYAYADVESKLNDLLSSMDWIQKRFGPTADHLDDLHQIDNHVLKPTWAATQRWIGSLKSEDLVWGGTKATILMGNIVLSCLERFAAHVEGDSLTASLTATLITVDATVSQILNGLAKHLSRAPLVDVLLTPLFAAGVSTAIFLRLYPLAHHRLESLLQLSAGQRRGRPAFVLTKFSEVLWSQLFHIRMALRVDSRQETSDLNHDERTTRSKGFPWEISSEIEEDNRVLLDRIQQMGLHLHHITLLGDRVLAHALSNCNFPTENQMDSERATKLKKVASDVLQAFLIGEVDSEEEDPKVSVLGTLEVEGASLEPILFSASPKSSPKISCIPGSLLLTGHTLETLSLRKCNLTLLPTSFGLYFPNLLDLDLSCNRIEQVPLSFKSMLRLERLMLSQNCVTELSGEEFMASLKCLDVSHNCLTQLVLDFIDSLGRRCFQMEWLDLSNNALDEQSRTLVELVAVPKWALQMKSLRQVRLMPQRGINEGVAALSEEV